MEKTRRRICLSTFINSGYARELLKGIGDAMAELDDWELVYLSAQELEKDAGRAFDGYICDVWSNALASRLAKSGKPVVNTLLKECGLRFPTIGPDPAASVALGIAHFKERRFSHLAFCGYAGVGFSERQRQEFLRQTASAGFTTHVYPVAKRRNQIEEIIKAMPIGHFADAADLELWLRKLPRPVAIICCNDLRAHDVLKACRKIGAHIPDDVAILGGDDDPVLCLISTPQLSSIDPDAYAIGRSAVELMAELMSGRTFAEPPYRQTPPSGLVTRRSTQKFLVEPKWLSDAIAYVHDHATKGISAADVVSFCGYSHTFVQKAFRERLNTTIQREIAAARLTAARQLVLSGDLPKAEIARRCGFKSPQYFSNCYANAFGETRTKRASGNADR